MSDRIQDQAINLDNLPESVQVDIATYCFENKVELPTTKYDALHYFLLWNGVIGFTSAVASIVNNK